MSPLYTQRVTYMLSGMAKGLLLAAAAFMAASAMPVPAASTVLATRANGSGAAYARFFSFGDSQIDTGNYFRYAADPGDCGRFPYGETFFHRSTGRCCDGRLIVDFIAERLGFPYWPPFLAGKTAEDFRFGANFAVSSATAMDRLFLKKMHIDPQGITPYTLSVQIRCFTKVLATLGSTDNERRQIMASSLFLVGQIGVNDYYQPFLQNRTLDFAHSLLVPHVIRFIGLSLEALVQLGAKTVYVPGLVPLGCVPHYLYVFHGSSSGDAYDGTGCLRSLNGLAAHHNTLLKARLAALRRAHPDVSIVYVDYYGEILSILASPARSGFDVATALDACCGGSGPHNADVTCGEPGYLLCPDPSRYVSWDGFHNTEAVNEIMARGMLDGPFATPPIMSGPRWTT